MNTGNALYTSFDTALRNAGSGSVLTVLKNTAFTTSYTVDKDIIIDLEGHTLTLNDDVELTKGNSYLVGDITVTFKNGTIEGEGLINNNIDASLIYEDCRQSRQD